MSKVYRSLPTTGLRQNDTDHHMDNSRLDLSGVALSSRCVVFYDHEVFFRNGSRMARECATVCERMSGVGTDLLGAIDGRLSFGDYQQLQAAYTHRSLSSPGDKLNAFRGIERIFEKGL